MNPDNVKLARKKGFMAKLIGMPFTVCDVDGEPIARFKTPEDAAMYIQAAGEGYTIRFDNDIVWHEGHESQPASESFDFVAETVYQRLAAPQV